MPILALYLLKKRNYFGSSVLSEYLIEVTGKYLSLLEATQLLLLRIDQTYWKSDFVLYT